MKIITVNKPLDRKLCEKKITTSQAMLKKIKARCEDMQEQNSKNGITPKPTFNISGLTGEERTTFFKQLPGIVQEFGIGYTHEKKLDNLMLSF